MEFTLDLDFTMLAKNKNNIDVYTKQSYIFIQIFVKVS